ncbi:MAG: AAA family ATPase [Ruminococcus sp.]|nr:AAA family ATPase [Ruminococcus sp.]
MKKVILKSLTLCNFKGEQSRTTQFNADVTTISGGNGLGKSRHFDAFMWLLFGKDAQDRKDYEVRTYNADGTLLHEVECSVTGVIDVDGEEITIKRESVEEWVKPRGQVDRVLKGTHNECWWNETPVNVREYDKRIGAILDASLFKMITNPLFFASMQWKLQRAELFNLAGTITDAEIAAENPEFQLLLDKLTNKSLVDFKAEIKAKKERLNKELNGIAPRIDQTQKLKPQSEDFAALEAEIADVDKQLADIDKILSDNAARIRAEYQEQQSKLHAINELESKRADLVRNAQQAAKEAAFEANASRRELFSNIGSKKRELSAMKRSLQTLTSTRDRYAADIAALEADIIKKRQEWHDENAKKYSGDDVCFHCGQQLPEAMRAKNLADFNNAKNAAKAKIQAQGIEMAKRLETLKKQHQDTIADIAKQEEENNALNAEITKLQMDYANMANFEPEEVVPHEVAGYAELTKQIEEAKAALSTDEHAADDTEHKAKKKEFTAKRDALKKRLATREEIARLDKEIADLNKQGQDIAQQIADLEKQEYIAQEFTRRKIDECESRINGMFHNVTFRLFDKTFEGNIYETCIPLVDGVPFGAANTAGQVNAGLDIINTLCRFHGICAPIFIDNRESVINLIPTESQIINLVVTNDNKLTIQ